MAGSQDSPRNERIQAAIDALQDLIIQRFPEATFRVECDIDDPEAIHLVATVDVEDRFEVFDLVTDRVMDFQIDEGIPIFVVPARPPERIRAMLAAPQPFPEALLAEDPA